MKCCWIEDDDEDAVLCGDRGVFYRNLPLCRVHLEATRKRSRSPVATLSRQALKCWSLTDFPGRCYFALLPDRSVKIGYSNTDLLLAGRMKALERQYRGPVVKLLDIPGGFVAEATMHERFDDYRLPGTGERFRLAGALADFLNAPLSRA